MRQSCWKDYQNGIFIFIHEQTGTKVAIPATSAIKERLESASQSKMTDAIVFYNGARRSYDTRLYSKREAKVRDSTKPDIGLDMVDFHRTEATEMTNINYINDEMRSMTGHKP